MEMLFCASYFVVMLGGLFVMAVRDKLKGGPYQAYPFSEYIFKSLNKLNT